MTSLPCVAIPVHNLAGYVSRKRPSPDFDAARTYYNEALSYDADHCPTLQYLTELNLQTGDTSGALASAERLCIACGSDSTYAAATRAAFNVTCDVHAETRGGAAGARALYGTASETTTSVCAPAAHRHPPPRCSLP